MLARSCYPVFFFCEVANGTGCRMIGARRPARRHLGRCSSARLPTVPSLPTPDGCVRAGTPLAHPVPESFLPLVAQRVLVVCVCVRHCACLAIERGGLGFFRHCSGQDRDRSGDPGRAPGVEGIWVTAATTPRRVTTVVQCTSEHAPEARSHGVRKKPICSDDCAAGRVVL